MAWWLIVNLHHKGGGVSGYAFVAGLSRHKIWHWRQFAKNAAREKARGQGNGRGVER
jgi:hypothetical protein